MAIFCLPQEFVKKLKETAFRGELDVKKLYEMTDAERRQFFTDQTNEEIGKFLNVKFEKAMIDENVNALTEFFSSTLEGKPKKVEVWKTVTDKIAKLRDLGVLDPASNDMFLKDLVSDALGVTVTEAEVKEIDTKAKNIQEAQAAIGDDLGMPSAELGPEKAQAQADFWKAQEEMTKYLQERNPSPLTSIASNVIGRTAMLGSVKSPLLNISSNALVAAFEASGRRAASGALKGTDYKLAADFVKSTIKTFQKSGYDVSRMESMDAIRGSLAMDETIHSEGPGKVRQYARVMEDLVFKNLMGAPDVAFSALNFADSVNLESAKLFKGDKVKAREAMTDSMRVSPLTDEGQILRAKGIFDAQVATFTHKTKMADMMLGVRRLLNNATGALRLGDNMMPFVKTPANVISLGLDYAGLGIPKGFWEMKKMIQAGEWGDKAAMRRMGKNFTQAGFGLTAALVLTANMKDEDFVGAYDPARAQSDALQNAGSNMFKLPGTDRWISIDYLGPLAPAVSAIMYARQAGRNPSEEAFQYGKGLASNLTRLPGLEDLMKNYDALKSTSKSTLGEFVGDTGKSLVEYAYSRFVPGGLSDVAKAFDPYERKATGVVEGLQAKIPGARNLLPEKKNVFGESIKSTTGIEQILFGSRDKKGTTTELTKEINRIGDLTGAPIKFTEWERSSGKEITQFKETLGDKAAEAQTYYGSALKKELETVTKSSEYKKADDEKKATLLNGANTKALDQTYKHYHFKYKKAKK